MIAAAPPQPGRTFAPALCRGVTAGLILLIGTAAPGAGPSDDIRFERDVEPILADNCYDCHGDRRQRGGLRLDYREMARIGGDSGAAIEPGDGENSRLIQRVRGTDAEGERMPPDGPYLDDDAIAILEAWIDADAPYPEDRTGSVRRESDHWAFQPIEDPAPPAVEDDDWARNSIDRFVLAKLEAEGIEPSEEADRYTLIRRLSLDLLGLPPTPEQVDAFVNDDRPGAYERLVDRLLASPHYGERWGRHWLDEARYADSHGYSIDGAREIWPYRDWVIHALNDDMPFDQFTIEQLAGDLLEDPTRDQLVATGFNRNTLINQEGGSDPEQFRVETVVDRTNTTSAVWLGLTMACAQCHTHKFDPVTQREYFQLYAFFNSGADRNRVPPTLRLPTEQQERELRDLRDELREAENELEAYDEDAEQRRAEWEADVAKGTQWHDVAVVEAVSEAGATFETLDDGSLLASGPNAESDVYTLTLRGPLEKITAIRLETLTHDSLPRNGPGRANNGNFVLNAFEVAGADLLRAEADHSQNNYEIANAIDGDRSSGWAINTGGDGPMNVDRTAVFVLVEPVELNGEGDDDALWRVTLRFGSSPAGYQIGRFRLAATDAAVPTGPVTEDVAEIAALDAADRSDAQQDRLDEAFAELDHDRRALARRVERLEQRRQRVSRSVTRTMVMRDLDEPRDTHIHIRGDFLRPGETVQRDTPDVLPPLRDEDETGDAGDPPNRLDLARWLVSEENPLTARVRVNRVWLRYFGRGLVETENDFGLRGTEPTHPDLLDHLATRFMQDDWSLKALHRRIVTSATYRQSSHARPDIAERDPLNELLARQKRIRVEAEIVRDQALAASGVLADRIGGPSVHPPQPDGVYAFTQRAKNWTADEDDDRYRRTLYTFFYRSAPYPLLSTLDVPNFNTTCTSRVRSNTPLQSLIVANARAMFEPAQAMGGRVLTELPEDADDRERIEAAFRWALARPPSGEELARLHSFLRHQRDAFAADPEAGREAGESPALPDDLEADPADLAAWIALSRVLINLDEFITRP